MYALSGYLCIEEVDEEIFGRFGRLVISSERIVAVLHDISFAQKASCLH